MRFKTAIYLDLVILTFLRDTVLPSYYYGNYSSHLFLAYIVLWPRPMNVDLLPNEVSFAARVACCRDNSFHGLELAATFCS